MSTTLTNGLKLPDKGSIDWYADMQSNYAILDGAVGTVAEHTTQIAGKAPAVHTHTKADITDFPAYGNTAGTICEGNDSRLSDARTPVAHTHTKSDVTDLFNSANTWSKAQTYSDGNAIVIKNSGVEIGNEPSAYNEQRVVFNDKNGYGIAAIKYQNQLSSSNVFINGLEFSASDKFKDGVRDPTGTTTTTVLRIGLWNDGTKYIYNEGRWRSNLLPFGNNTNDVGSSSYQWNNLYAKNYYYNGTAWGLDKANVWTQSQTISINLPVFTLQDTIGVRNTTPTNVRNLTFNFLDKNGDSYGFINRQHKSGTGTHLHQVSIQNGTYDYRLQFYLFTDGSSSFVPSNNGVIELGTSTAKWKTLNGINPGALSLPNSPGGSGTVNVNYYDLSSIVTIRDGSGVNSYQPVCDGWIAINSFATWIQIANDTTLVCVTGAIGADGFGQCYLPVRKNDNIRIVINQTNTNFQSFKLIPCQGNV